MKKTYQKDKVYSSQKRELIFQHYYSKFYNLFMSKWDVEGLDYQQVNFMFRKFWDIGKIAAWTRKYEDKLGLNDYAPILYNQFDFPKTLTLIPNRGDPAVPVTPMEVDKDVVIGWAQKSMKPIKETIELYCSKLANIEMLLRTSEKVMKTPWLLGVSSANEEKVRQFENLLDTDESSLFFEFEDGEMEPKALVSGAPYVLDKLYQQKIAYENEVLTFLGCNNLGNVEKKEHVTNAEVNNNNQLIASSDDNFTSSIEEFIKRVNETLGYNLKLIKKDVKTIDIFDDSENAKIDEGDEVDEME